jgi:hypothetical protein
MVTPLVAAQHWQFRKYLYLHKLPFIKAFTFLFNIQGLIPDLTHIGYLYIYGRP